MSIRPPRNGEKIEKNINTLLVDGNALFKRSFTGSKNSYNRDGEYVGGLYSFFNILRSILENDVYHKVFVFWDGNFSGKLRYDLYKDYKIARGKDYLNGTQPIDESELNQRRLVWDYLNEMYIRQLKHEIIESDDFIAYYCLIKKQNEKITICSSDRDFCQLVNDDVRLYLLDLRIFIAPINFSSYFCYHKDNSVLFKTMTGDSSDSIKGIKGLGEGTLINLFPEIKEKKVSIDDLIESAKKQQEQRINNKLKPLKVLTNIINSITDGVQGKEIYEINEKLVNLKKPMLTEDGIINLENLIDGTLDSSGRELKNVLIMMKRDGLDKIIGENRYPEYLIPFKKLIDREKQTQILTNNN